MSCGVCCRSRYTSPSRQGGICPDCRRVPIYEGFTASNKVIHQAGSTCAASVTGGNIVYNLDQQDQGSSKDEG